jgi:hypothetical protein
MCPNLRTDVPGTLHAPGKHRRRFGYGIRPRLETFLNDPSGFFKYRLGISGWVSYQPWTGASLVTGLAAYPINNISTSNEPLSIPVRSDIAFYKQEDITLERVLYDQIIKLTPELYGKFSAGILEIQYAGLDGEIAMPLFDGRVMVGISGSAVMKRDPDDPFGLLDSSDNPKIKDLYTTAFFNTRLNIPELEVAVDMNAGRFLAGDNGVRFIVSKYIRGVTIWAWYSFTDTSIFSDPFNDGYHDKGIGIAIPFRLFKGTDSRSVFTYAIAPWTRDVAQDIEHFGTLFNFIGRNTKVFLDKDKKMMYR